MVQFVHCCYIVQYLTENKSYEMLPAYRDISPIFYNPRASIVVEFYIVDSSIAGTSACQGHDNMQKRMYILQTLMG